MSDDAYGTVVRLRARPGKADDLIRTFKAQTRSPSALAHTIIRSDADPDVLWIAGVHRSREAYRANAETPEQNARFEELRQFLADEPPQWNDGDVVHFEAE